MASNEEGDRTPPRGNEWEVVSLSASAYAAAPGPEQMNTSHDNHDSLGGENEIEVSYPMFMSGHFVFPPSQHENLALEPEYNEINDDKGDEFDIPPFGVEDGGKSDVKDEGNASIEELMSDKFSSFAHFGKDAVFDKDKSISSSAHSLNFEDNASDSGFLNFEEPAEAESYECSDLPCEAWWRRRAVTLYTQAKETNTIWSIFIAAAVMGLVIIGHGWQQERWKASHLKWQSGVIDKRVSWMFGPISRVKNVIVGGYRPGSLVQGSTSS